MCLPTEDLYIPLGTNHLLEMHIEQSEAKVYYISTIMLAGHELLRCTCSGGSMLWMLSLTVVIVESYKHTIAMESCCTRERHFLELRETCSKQLEPLVVVVAFYSKQLINYTT